MSLQPKSQVQGDRNVSEMLFPSHCLKWRVSPPPTSTSFSLSLSSNSVILRCCSVAKSCLTATPWTAAHQTSLSSLSKFAQTHVHWVGDVIQPSHPLSLLLFPSIFPSIKVFTNKLALCIRWPKDCSFSISPSNEYSGLISFRTDWFDLLAVQGTLKSLLQHHSLKASILWCSAFFTVQLSYPYMSTRKTTALTRQNFVSKVMSLLSPTHPLCIFSYFSLAIPLCPMKL